MLDVYPKLYYFIPCIRRHVRSFAGTTFKFDEPMDAMLWFLDILGSQTTGAHCTRSKLKGLVCRWYGREASTNFDRAYKILEKVGFITWEPNPEDNKKHDVWITEKGQQLLEEVKSQRLQQLSTLRQVTQALTPEEQEVTLRVLSMQAESAWTEMMNVEEFQEITNAKRSNRKGTNRKVVQSQNRSRKKGFKKR